MMFDVTRKSAVNYMSLGLLWVMLGFVISGSGRAAEGVAYPDSALVRVVWEVANDTITVRVDNMSLTPVDDFFLTDITNFPCTLIDVQVDGKQLAEVPIDFEFGTLITDHYTTRFVVGEFVGSVSLRYYSASYQTARMMWSAGQPYPIFGMADTVLSVCCEGMRGNVDGDVSDELTIADLVYLVNYMFGTPSGPAPVCFDEADVNADGVLDIVDLVSVVNYMFADGIALEQCF